MTAQVEECPRKFWSTKPKFALQLTYADTILELGNVELVSTEFGERSHKDVKAAVPFTNHHPETALEQV